MAQNKIAFTKLGLKMPNDVQTFKYKDLDIEVKQYLPVEEQLQMIAAAINETVSTDANKFLNVIKLRMYLSLEIVFHYTNLTFTDKQKENLPKLYDLLASNNFFDKLFDYVPSVGSIFQIAEELGDRIYAYNNSAYGILDNVSKDYSDLSLDIDKLRSDMANAENLDIVKQVVTKLS